MRPNVKTHIRWYFAGTKHESLNCVVTNLGPKHEDVNKKY